MCSAQNVEDISMQSNPLFSVITCTRNSLPYVTELRRSVETQTFADYEHIFVDGASSDGTLEYLHSLSPSARVIENVTGGIAKAMNTGIHAARGEILVHLHSDDYFLHPRVLERVALHFSQHDNRWLFGRIVSDIDGGIYPESFIVPAYSYERLLRGNFIPHPATFIRREVFEELGDFDEAIRYAMDYDYWLRIASRYPPLALREAFSVFRRHQGSTTQANLAASMAEDFSRRLHHEKGGLIRRMSHHIRYLVRKRRLGL